MGLAVFQKSGFPAAHLTLCLLVCLFLLAPPGAGARESSGDAPVYLKSVKILGNVILPDKDLKKQLTLPRPSIWPWKKLPEFKESELDYNVELLKAYYRRQGFYSTEITTKVDQDGLRRVTVVIIIDEGPWIMTDSITVDLVGEPLVLDLASLAARRPLKVGTRFTEAAYEELKSLYLNELFQNGYPRGEVEGRVYLDEKRHLAEVVLTVDAGPRSFFGQTTITGRPVTPDYIIRRQLAYRPGDLFDVRKIYQSQRNLYKLDLFSSAAVTPQDVPPSESLIPLEVSVTEAKRRSVTGGVGWGTEDQVRARLGLRLRNLFGGGRYLDFEGRYAQIDSRFAATFTNPQIGGSFTDLIVASGWFYREYPSFNDRTLSGQLRLERQLPWGIKGYLGYLLQFDQPSGVPGTVQSLFSQSQSQRFRTSLGFVGLRRDSTDDLINPTRGGMVSGHLDVAPGFFGSQVEFVATRLEGRRFVDLWQKEYILAGRAVLGLMEPLGRTAEIPLFRRFFTGGYNTVRGYRLFILGPTDIAGNPVGGQSLLEANAELRFPLYKELRGVAFVDAGNVYPTISDLSPGNLKYGVGFGVRYNTPIGPVGLDIAFPVNRVQARQDSVQVYFAIGQTF